MTMECPYCGQQIAIVPEQEGRMGTCPHCAKEIEMRTRPYRYWAFISYTTADRPWAEWLHRSIESYGIPARLGNNLLPTGEKPPRKFHPVFFDREEMSASADLGATLRTSLLESRFLIVICSRAAAKSRWVNEEIATFNQLGRRARVFSLIIDGRPDGSAEEQCFPPALRDHLDGTEPAGADLRPKADGKRGALLRLIAGMLAVDRGELILRDAQRRRRRLILATAICLMIVLGAGILLRKNYETGELAKGADRKREVRQYLEELQQAGPLWNRGDIPSLQSLLSRFKNERLAPAQKFEWQYWNRLAATPPFRSFPVPGEPPSAVVMNSDGRLVAVHRKSGKISVHDGASGAELYQASTPARAFLFSPDGRNALLLPRLAFSAATARQDQGPLQILDARNGRKIGVLGTKPFTVCMTAAGNETVMTGSMSDLVVWQLSTRTLGGTLEGNGPPTRPSRTSPVNDIWADGTFTVTGNENGSVCIFDRSGILRKNIEATGREPAPVLGVSLSPDRRLLAFQTAHDVRVVRTDSGEIQSRWVPHPPPASRHPAMGSWIQGSFRPIFSSDSARVFTSGTRSLQVWDARSGTLLHELAAGAGAVDSAGIAPEAGLLATVGPGTVRIFPADRASSRTVAQIRSSVLGLCLSPDGSRIAAVCEKDGSLVSDGKPDLWRESHQIRIWNIMTGRQIAVTEELKSQGTVPWFSNDGLEVGCGAGRFDAATGKPLARSVPGGKSRSTQVFAGPGGKIFLSLSPAGPGRTKAELIAGGSAKTVTLAEAPDAELQIVAFSGDGRLVAAAGTGGSLRIWKTGNGEALGKTVQADTAISTMAFSADGKLLATGGDDRKITVRDVGSGQIVSTMAGHIQEVCAICFSADGSMLVGAGGRADAKTVLKGDVRLWDVATGQLRMDLPTDRFESFSSVAMSSDGRRIFAAANDRRPLPGNDLDNILLSSHLDPKSEREFFSGRVLCWETEAAGEPTATAAAKPLPQTPTGKKKPPAFSNSLGMDFMPVSGTDVLFCTIETRVRDWQVFDNESPTPQPQYWRHPEFLGQKFEPQPDHPVVMVSWNDANNFCDWLTQRERKSGAITGDQSYRLPDDREWSLAAGLGAEPGDSPEKRSEGIKGVYPWGGTFPPPADAGNYGFHSDGPDARPADGFPFTAPVASFAPNAAGLYDLGGNVWELCSSDRETKDGDPARPGATKVMRGGGWPNDAAKLLLSSMRGGHPPESRQGYAGFRIVLAPGKPAGDPAR